MEGGHFCPQQALNRLKKSNKTLDGNWLSIHRPPPAKEFNPHMLSHLSALAVMYIWISMSMQIH